MVISHNILSLNTSRQLGMISKDIKTTSEKLSSGYRINRAADDAAGLSISEKMRKQIRGLTQGIANAEDGISLCQVADGALNEVTDLIQRISELAVKSANGTNSTSDREDIQMEVSALLEEIDRIGDTTKFNELYIFKGERGENSAPVTGKPTANGRFFQLLGNNVSHTGYMNEPLTESMVTKSTSSLDPNYVFNDPNNPFVSVHVNLDALQGHLSDLAGTQFFVNCCTDCCPKTVYFTDDSSIQFKTEFYDLDGYDRISELRIGLKKADGNYFSDAKEFCKYIVDTLDPILNQSSLSEHVQFAYKDSTLYLYDIDNKSWSPTDKELAYFCDSDDFMNIINENTPHKQIFIQSGADAGDGIMLNISAVNRQILELDDLDVLTVHNADQAIKATNKALHHVSTNRSRIGAYQNRLEHTIKNEENIIENTTAAESQIRDTNMATAMVRHANISILQQAGQAMLAQANHISDGVLALI